MRIVHICLCDSYSEGWSYHRNIISKQNAKDGHETYIVATMYGMNDMGSRGAKESSRYTNEFGVHVIRLSDRMPFPKMINSKINTVKGITKILEQIHPDIIMVHNVQSFNLYDITKYKRKHKEVMLLADTHASFANSCRSWFSRRILQGVIFKKVINSNYSFFDGMYYISTDELFFFQKEYGIVEENNNILPLPASFVDVVQKQDNRRSVRELLGLEPEELLFVHSGKMTKEKKTMDVLQCLKEHKDARFRLLIFGSIPPEQHELLAAIDEDSRVSFKGWVTAQELSMYISAADLYIQPGSVSVTLQNALSAGTPAMIYPHEGYAEFFSGWEVLVRNRKEMYNQFDKIFSNPQMLQDMSEKAYKTAKKYFDCSAFANEMYSYIEQSGKPKFSYTNGIRYVSSQ